MATNLALIYGWEIMAMDQNYFFTFSFWWCFSFDKTGDKYGEFQFLAVIISLLQTKSFAH